MVDLVKIRKKSKEAKEAAHEAPDMPALDPSLESSPEGATPGATAIEPVLEIATAPEKELLPPEPIPVVEAADVPSPGKAERSKRRRLAGAPSASKEAPPEVLAPAPAPRPAPAVTSPADDVEAEPGVEDRLERFKRLAGTRRSWSDTAKREGSDEDEEAVPELELLRFRVAGEDYAVDIDKIVEIVPPRSTTRVPNAHETIVGIISLRGTIVTVLDLRRKLGHPPANGGEARDARMIVVERAGETAGFLVDRVSRVIKLDPAQLESHPVVSSSEQSEYVSGVFQASDGLVILLDLEKILAG